MRQPGASSFVVPLAHPTYPHVDLSSGAEPSVRRTLELYEKAARCGYGAARVHLDALMRRLHEGEGVEPAIAPLFDRRVTVHGLEEPAVDGQCGEAIDFDATAEMHSVRLDGSKDTIKVAKGCLKEEAASDLSNSK